jgi:hypothetical protein
MTHAISGFHTSFPFQTGGPLEQGLIQAGWVAKSHLIDAGSDRRRLTATWVMAIPYDT